MGFENPGYLWGVLAAAIPLILHLIARRRAQVHSFAAMEFLLASNKRIARRLKLKQILLLLSRMMLLAAIAVAFAKPFTLEQARGLPGTTIPGSLVLIIDPSFSMGYIDGDQTLLEKAKQKAQEVVGDLPNESDAAVVVASSPARALTQTLTFDRGLLLQAVDSVELGHQPGDIQGALRLAEQILAASNQPQRDVILLTDLQATEWEGITRPWSLERSPNVSLMDMRAKREHANVAITRVDATPESRGVDRDVRISVELLNDRPQAFEDVVTVKVGGKTAKGIIRVPAGQRATKEFTIRLSDVGSISGFVEVPDDALSGDNRHPFVIDFLRRINVLIVNGSARTVPHRDEAFFLRAALRPGQEAMSPISVNVVKPDELTSSQLQYVDVVVLANVAELESSQRSELERWVRNGGGLFISSGENVSVATYNNSMRSLLPLPLRDIRDASDRPLFLTAVRTQHPMLDIFSHLPDASLFTTQTHRYVLLETAASSKTQVLASYTDGAPALVERDLGAGHVVMLTTTIDRDWTDLPFKTSYLPLVQQIVLYLSGKLNRTEQPSLVVGETRKIEVGADVTLIEVERPDGEKVVFEGVELVAGEVRFHSTSMAGIYRVYRHRPQGVESTAFSVQLDPRESILKSADSNAIETLLESRGNTQLTTATPSRKSEQKGELWPVFLLALFALLGVETWLAFAAG